MSCSIRSFISDEFNGFDEGRSLGSTPGRFFSRLFITIIATTLTGQRLRVYLHMPFDWGLATGVKQGVRFST